VAALELAICAPVFIYILYGVWELGQFIHVQQMVANCAREGARQASTGLKTASATHPELPFDADYEVQNSVLYYMQNAGLNTTTMSVTVTNVTQGLSCTVVKGGSTPVQPSDDPVAAGNQMDVMQISVAYPYNTISISPVNFFIASGTPMTATAQWYCLKDLPIADDQNIPSAPQ
jgi:Flp pilus assembly protein TadG